VWPFDAGRDVVRIGRHGIERWARRDGGLRLSGEIRLTASEVPSADTLGSTVRAIAASTNAATRPVDVVLESTWLPVLSIPVSEGWWADAKLDALLRHYLYQLYGAAEGGEWTLRVEHAAGSPLAIGFGLDPAVLEAVRDGGLRAATVQPAIAWAWQRFAKHRRLTRADWFCLVEQDRSILCKLSDGEMVSVNAGATRPSDAAQVAQLVAIEQVRRGVARERNRALVASWEPVASRAGPSTDAVICVAAAQREAGSGLVAPHGDFAKAG
jgi:hypothetical protein